jgi:hypothetical protein
MAGTSCIIKSRPLRSADIPAIARFLPNQFMDPNGRSIQFDPGAACELLLDQGVMTGTVFAKVDDGTEALLAVGGAVFVTDEYLQALKTASQPFVSERILSSAGRSGSGLLPPGAIGRANERHGLNIVVLLHEWDRAGADAEFAREIRIRLVKGFLDHFRGFRLREVLGEVQGQEELQWALAGGYILRDDYAEWYRTRTHPSPHRYLVSITRQEALALESSLMSLLFHYREPVCGFTVSERQLLHAALTLQTDVEIASALGISLAAVKKRWITIYDRVAGRIPELRAVISRGGLTRGPQKRHKLLSYLREHPEELRP